LRIPLYGRLGIPLLRLGLRLLAVTVWILLQHLLLCLALKVLPPTEERRLEELWLKATFHLGDGDAL
jgi:hypothetical protein